MKPQYKKGPAVAREFEEAMKRVFQTPKPQPEEKQPKSASECKSERRDKD